MTPPAVERPAPVAPLPEIQPAAPPTTVDLAPAPAPPVRVPPPQEPLPSFVPAPAPLLAPTPPALAEPAARPMLPPVR
ncbi:MAG TPA: hypothetical protein VET86_16235, partial [Casimicrobiaceae bacterium]|nr:hypothetical protein [Casimicrobiaceae bacterium]